MVGSQRLASCQHRRVVDLLLNGALDDLAAFRGQFGIVQRRHDIVERTRSGLDACGQFVETGSGSRVATAHQIDQALGLGGQVLADKRLDARRVGLQKQRFGRSRASSLVNSLGALERDLVAAGGDQVPHARFSLRAERMARYRLRARSLALEWTRHRNGGAFLR